VPYLSASEVCPRRGAIQIHVYFTLPYLMDKQTVEQPERPGTIALSDSIRRALKYNNNDPVYCNRSQTATKDSSIHTVRFKVVLDHASARLFYLLLFLIHCIKLLVICCASSTTMYSLNLYLSVSVFLCRSA